MTNRKPIALVGADFHFSDKMPRCRHEVDWLDYQKQKMQWLNSKCGEHGVPLIIVGDIFDKSRHSNELVNTAIDNLPESFITSGNHDLPYHSLELEHKSAYGSLKRSEIASELNDVFPIGDVSIYPFHFGHEGFEVSSGVKGIKVALIHEFVWESIEPFPGAPPKGEVNELIKRFKGFDIIIAGDHHHHFITKVEDTVVLNCGSLMRISAAQIDYQPMVHLLFDDGSFDHIEVPCVDDRITREHLDSKKNVQGKIDRFVRSLDLTEDEKDSCSKISFEDKVRQAITVNDVEPEVVEIIEECMV